VALLASRGGVSSGTAAQHFAIQNEDSSMLSTIRKCHMPHVFIALAILALGQFAPSALAQTGDGGHADVQLLKQTIDKGLAFLREKGQAADGTFSRDAGPGLTALAVSAALRHGRPLDDPLVAKGLKALEGFVKPDGGIYGNGRLRNYETCVAITCLQLANKDGRYKTTLANADKFVRGLMYGADGTKDAKDPWFGGVGYGGPGRPDLSNTSYLIEALKALDAGADDAALQRALLFVSRCQNLNSPANDTPFAGLVDDGGFYYAIPTEAVDPSTSDRYTPNGGLRSYGSMTYAGFKSMIYAGLTKDDPRVKAALAWIQSNYAVDKNPGEGDAGLYYYYNTFAAALAASGLDEIVDAQGQSHDWRKDLVAELARRQRPDGSWANTNRQWLENDPNLATAFALVALSCCQPQSN
jgi:squalene-hopene/tetraprenyl-beta-curcumene cyclase